MFITLTRIINYHTPETTLVNLDSVRNFNPANISGDFPEGTAIIFINGDSMYIAETISEIKTAIRKEAQKQTSVVSRFELLDIDKEETCL